MMTPKAQKNKFGDDPVIRYLINSAHETSWIEKMILFGSRARGNPSERSDYDIAVVTTQDDSWPKWVLNVKEQAPTLCGLDIVKLDHKTSDSLKKAIAEEGRVIYEQL